MSAIAYSVRRSTRARRVRVVVHADRGVEVVLPQRAPARAAEQAIAELRPWVERRLRAADRARIPRPEGTLEVLGRTLILEAQDGRRRVHRRGDVLLVPAVDPGPALERHLRRVARAEIASRLDRAVAEAGTRYSGLTIRAQRTRWASCSSGGHMSFNWRLVLAPVEVLDYVVWHEVCHLEVMDHSPRFWALLESRRPGWREQAAWLRRHGSSLVL